MSLLGGLSARAAADSCVRGGGGWLKSRQCAVSELQPSFRRYDGQLCVAAGGKTPSLGVVTILSWASSPDASNAKQRSD